MTGVAPDQPAQTVLGTRGAFGALHAVVAAAGDTHLPEVGEVLIPRALEALPAVSVLLAGIAQNAAAIAGATDTGGAIGTEVTLVGGAVTVIVLAVAGLVGGDAHHVDAAAVHADLGLAAALGQIIRVPAGVHPPDVSLVTGQRAAEALGAPTDALFTAASVCAGLDLFAHVSAGVHEVGVALMAAPTRLRLALDGRVRGHLVVVAVAVRGFTPEGSHTAQEKNEK